MRKFWIITLLISVSLTLTSCRGKIERMRQKVKIEQIDAVRPMGLTRLDVDLTATNGTAHKMQLTSATAIFLVHEAKVATLQLIEPITLPRRSTEQLTSSWSVKIHNPLALLAVAQQLRNGEQDSITIQLQLEGRGGPIPINIERGPMPLSEFLRIFGLDANQLNQYLP